MLRLVESNWSAERPRCVLMPKDPAADETLATSDTLPTVRDVQLRDGDAQQLFAWAESNHSLLAADQQTMKIGFDHEQAPSGLECLQVLRWLPPRRLVFIGLLDGTKVVVKLFLGTSCDRYAEREKAGIGAIRSAAIATPALIADWALKDDSLRLRALILEFVEAVAVTAELVATTELGWSDFARVLARLNEQGYAHEDFHLGNLLYQRDQLGATTQLWLVDGDGVRASRRAQSKPYAISQFAEMCAQAERALSGEQVDTAWRAYCGQRGWTIAAGRDDKILRCVGDARRRRILRYQIKTRRQCSAVSSTRANRVHLLVNRDWWRDNAGSVKTAHSQAFSDWLRELPMNFSGYEVLKAGNTATLSQTLWEGHPLVIKRYNNKSVWHRLRRFVRPDRGLNSWVYGHTLGLVGISSPTPVALSRTRFAGPTYLVMSAIDGETLTAQHCEQSNGMFEQCAAMLDALAAEGIVHGDMKASNLLVQSVHMGQKLAPLFVLDLDAMRMPRWRIARRSGEIRDKRRFLRNFAGAPSAQQRFRSILEL